jgi:hypothetical protein
VDIAMRERIAQAEGSFENRMLEIIVAAATVTDTAGRRPHWTAAAWLLERRWPEDYGRRVPALHVAAQQAVHVDEGPRAVPTVPLVERVAGILRVLDGAGKLDEARELQRDRGETAGLAKERELVGNAGGDG